MFLPCSIFILCFVHFFLTFWYFILHFSCFSFSCFYSESDRIFSSWTFHCVNLQLLTNKPTLNFSAEEGINYSEHRKGGKGNPSSSFVDPPPPLENPCPRCLGARQRGEGGNNAWNVKKKKDLSHSHMLTIASAPLVFTSWCLQVPLTECCSRDDKKKNLLHSSLISLIFSQGLMCSWRCPLSGCFSSLNKSIMLVKDCTQHFFQYSLQKPSLCGS